MRRNVSKSFRKTTNTLDVSKQQSFIGKIVKWSGTVERFTDRMIQICVMDFSANIYQVVFHLPHDYFRKSNTLPAVGTPMTLMGRINNTSPRGVDLSAMLPEDLGYADKIFSDSFHSFVSNFGFYQLSFNLFGFSRFKY
jgi:hypothetical protein